MSKDTPNTHVIQCEKCELIMRIEGDDSALEKALELPTFCHLIPDDDLTNRRVTCMNKRFKHVTDEAA